MKYNFHFHQLVTNMLCHCFPGNICAVPVTDLPAATRRPSIPPPRASTLKSTPHRADIHPKHLYPGSTTTTQRRYVPFPIPVVQDPQRPRRPAPEQTTQDPLTTSVSTWTDDHETDATVTSDDATTSPAPPAISTTLISPDVEFLIDALTAALSALLKELFKQYFAYMCGSSLAGSVIAAVVCCCCNPNRRRSIRRFITRSPQREHNSDDPAIPLTPRPSGPVQDSRVTTSEGTGLRHREGHGGARPKDRVAAKDHVAVNLTAASPSVAPQVKSTTTSYTNPFYADLQALGATASPLAQPTQVPMGSFGKLKEGDGTSPGDSVV